MNPVIKKDTASFNKVIYQEYIKCNDYINEGYLASVFKITNTTDFSVTVKGEVVCLNNYSKYANDNYVIQYCKLNRQCPTIYTYNNFYFTDAILLFVAIVFISFVLFYKEILNKIKNEKIN